MLLGATAHNRPQIRYAWRGSSVLIVDNEGRSGMEHLTGFYFRQTRYLHDLRLELEGEAPFPCSLAEVEPHELELTYVYPPVPAGAGGGSGSGASGRRHGILFRNLDLTLRYRVHPASLEAVLVVTSRWDERIECDLAWVLSADYAGTSEVQSGKRQQEAEVEATAATNGVRFQYLHPQLPLETHVWVKGVGDWLFADGRLSTRLSLDRQERAEVRLHVHAVDCEDPIGEAGEKRREECLNRWFEDYTRLHALGETPLAELTNRAMHDLGSLALLDGQEAEWLTPGAGLPLYRSLWARDALTAAWQAAVFDRGRMLEDVLEWLNRTQGREVDPEHDEQPGRILNQAKRDPLSRLGEEPFGRYYADVASPFMFVISLGQLLAWSGEKRLLERHWEAAKRVLEWAKKYGDRDGDGYIEYLTHNPKGPKHQGWKDSDNAIVYEDGRQVEPPLAVCEIQGYYFASLQFMAVLSAVMGERENALSLWRQAKELKERFNRDFWMEEEGFVAQGLDAEKRQIKSLTSNAGQCLTTGIVSDEHLPRLVRRLFEPDLFSGWGIRTLSSRNPAYNPLSYHLGSVWPVENGTILFGLRRYGFEDRAVELARALYDLARLWEGGRTPECVGGYSREELRHPGAYPRANSPQAWNQSVFPILVQTLLGMRPVASLNLLAIYPLLPPWLPELVVKRLRVGEATVTLRFWREKDGDAQWETVEQEGTLHILRQPPVDSLTVGLWDRLGALVEDVLPF